jgi:hypothetical protein
MHNYFFVTFFVISNMFLLNVLIGFIIDNIIAYLSEENQDDEESRDNEESSNERMLKEQELQKGLFGKFYSIYTGTKKMSGNIKNIGIGIIKGVNDATIGVAEKFI